MSDSLRPHRTVAHQASPSMEFSRQEYWSGLPFPSLGDLPDPGIEPGSPLQADTLPSEPLEYIHSSVNGRLDCFHFLAIVNNAAVNTGVHISFQMMVFSGCMPSSGMAGSYDSFIPTF